MGVKGEFDEMELPQPSKTDSSAAASLISFSASTSERANTAAPAVSVTNGETRRVGLQTGRPAAPRISTLRRYSVPDAG
jgi:hypothetical protein